MCQDGTHRGGPNLVPAVVAVAVQIRPVDDDRRRDEGALDNFYVRLSDCAMDEDDMATATLLNEIKKNH